MGTSGERIKELREQQNMTQHNLGEKLFVSDKAVSKWETDKNEPEVSALVKMAELFHVSIDYLTTGKINENKNYSVSKIELACREDNVALLDGVDFNAFDENGKDLKYYANYYDAKNVLKLIDDYDFQDFVNSGHLEKKEREFVICAIPKDLEGEENLVLIRSCKRDNVSRNCSELEGRGYHSFKIFYEKEFYDKCSKDYQYMDINVLNNEGKHMMCIQLVILDDDMHARFGVSYYYDKGDKRSINALIQPKDYNEFTKVLEEIEFKDWDNKHWGYPVFEIYYALAKEELDKNMILHNRFYISPSKEKYKKFIKAIQKLALSSLKESWYKEFVRLFNTSVTPYYRENLSIDVSESTFKKIESEDKFMTDKYGHPF